MNIMKKFLAAAAILCVSTAFFTGCGDSDSDSDKNSESSESSQSADAGDNDSPDTYENGENGENSSDENDSASGVVGKWEPSEYLVDGEPDDEMNGVPIAQSVHLEVNKDGTCHFWGSGRDYNGTWVFSGETLTITIDDEPADFEFKNGRLILSDNGHELTFSRVNEFTGAAEDSSESDIAGKWEVSEIIEDDTTYTGEYKDVPIAKVIQMEINSDGTLTAMSAASDDDVSGTWELDGEELTTFVNNKTDVFEYKDGRIIFESDGNQMIFKKVSQFTE